MKSIILCGGYATRLYPLTLNQPKALLPIAGKPLLNYIMEKIEEIEDIDEIAIVSNGKFYPHFKSWLRKYNNCFSKKIEILNDNTYDNETRLGGLGDLWFAVKEKNIDDDILVLAGDNLFDFSLKEFIDFFKQNNKISNVLYKLGDRDKAKRFGVVELKDNKIISFEEKPEKPKSDLISMALYIYSKSDLKKIEGYMSTDFPKEGPGHLIQYFFDKQHVLGFIVDGEFFDIGVLSDYEKANEIWKIKRRLLPKEG